MIRGTSTRRLLLVLHSMERWYVMISFNKYVLVPVLRICHFVYALETFVILLRLDNVDMLLVYAL